MKDKTLTPLYARCLVRLIRPFPDFDFFFIKSLRKKAVELLELKKSDRVLDAGCGTGGSLPYLINAVGTSGEVVGVEISPEVTINTRNRIEKNDWKNIQIIEGSAQTVKLKGMYDGLLMFAASDVYASHEALENIFPNLKERSRVVLFGAKTSNNRIARILNPFIKIVFKKFSFATTPKPDSEPWQMLTNYIDKINIEEYFFGLMFLASGYVKKIIPDKKP